MATKTTVKMRQTADFLHHFVPKVVVERKRTGLNVKYLLREFLNVLKFILAVKIKMSQK